MAEYYFGIAQIQQLLYAKYMNKLQKQLLRLLPLFFFLAFFHPDLSANCTFEPTTDKRSQDKITEIVTKVATYRALSLGIHKKHLEKLGKEVDEKVNFLQFWAFIFNDPKLAHYMKKIQDSSMRYDRFIAGGHSAVYEAYNKDPECLLEQLEGFSLYLKLDKKQTEVVKSHFKAGLEPVNKDNKESLKPFFDYLIAEKNK